MRTPQVAVIMSIFNGELYARTSITSILEQTYSDYEFIIVNDGSTDSTEEILQEFNKIDSRISVISHKNIGLTKSLNMAIQNSTAPLIARQDMDDFSLPQRLQTQVNFMSNNRSTVLLGTAARILMIGHTSSSYRYVFPPAKDNEIRNCLRFMNCFLHSSVMFRRSTFEKAGKYNERFRYSQDIELWQRMAHFGRMHNLQDVLLEYRTHKNSISNKHFSYQTSLAALSSTLYNANISPEKVIEYTSNICSEEDITKIIIDNRLDTRHYNLCCGKTYFSLGKYKEARSFFKNSYFILSAPAFNIYLLISKFPAPLVRFIVFIKDRIKAMKQKMRGYDKDKRPRILDRREIK